MCQLSKVSSVLPTRFLQISHNRTGIYLPINKLVIALKNGKELHIRNGGAIVLTAKINL